MLARYCMASSVTTEFHVSQTVKGSGDTEPKRIRKDCHHRLCIVIQDDRATSAIVASLRRLASGRGGRHTENNALLLLQPHFEHATDGRHLLQYEQGRAQKDMERKGNEGCAMW
jgi:hypothetical protein